MIHLECRDTVALVTLDRSVTNALNLPLVDELIQVVQAVKDDTNVRSLVLGSANDKFFSIGFDIPELFELAQSDLEHFYRAINRLYMQVYTLPKPTVAAITGHAIAGGCILALCCDYRLIAEGRKLMGLNEIKLGVPVPYVADCILRHLVELRYARDMMDAGEFYPPDELLRMGVVDQVLSLNEVLPRSIEKACSLGMLPQQAFAVIKGNRVEVVEAQICAHLEKKIASFVACWYSPAARQRLREAMEKF